MTEKEYNQCVTEYADNVYRFALKNLRNTEDARDVVQSAFEKMWVYKADVGDGKGKSYLFTIAYHLILDHVRRVKKKTSIESEMKKDYPEEPQSYDRPMNNTRKVLEAALAQLDETQRSLVLLKDYEGYSYVEIGQITGLNESQVKVYLHRARVQLRNYLVSPQNVI
jgi:RNA polymerase sigma-70 factor (ECF subfamily)